MKVNGVIKVGQLALPEKSPVQVGSVEIQYEAEFAVNEMVEALNLVRSLPDVFAEFVSKMKAYEEAFSKKAQEDARREVEMAMHPEEQSA